MDFTIQQASPHTQGVGSGLADRAPGVSPESDPVPVPVPGPPHQLSDRL